jgi:hypothetical protein
LEALFFAGGGGCLARREPANLPGGEWGSSEMFRHVAALAALLVLAAQPALAGDCSRMMDAVLKGDRTPHRIYSQSVAGGATSTWQTVEVGGKRWRGEPGAWKAMPFDSDKEDAAFKKVLDDNGNACTVEGSEAVDGETADIVVFQFGEGGLTAQIKLWISQGSGLTLKMQTAVAGLGQDKTVTATFDYKDVVAPAGAP